MFVKTFKKINKKSVQEAGGKGASLGEMTQANIPIPKGLVVLSQAFDHYLDITNIEQDIDAQLKKINYEDINSVDRYSNVIRDIIDDTAIPKELEKEIMKEYKKLKTPFVAVRSSATAEDSSIASWAGELETYLNTTEKTLLKNVKKCWSSLFTPRAIYYRKEKQLDKSQVSVAVVIQEMVDSDISGITFTVHPVTQSKNQMLIEAGYGLGEAIVSGSVTPDNYVVDKKEMLILDINISEQEKEIVKCLRKGVKWKNVKKTLQEKQKLTGKQIIELASICKHIEEHYKFACDIEWAFKDGKFYITQSRPITTLS